MCIRDRLTASGADLPFTYDSVNDRILDALQGLVNQMLSINEMPAIQTLSLIHISYTT